MTLRSSPILGFICLSSILAMDTKFDCKDIAASGLMDAMWFSAAVAVSDANTQAQIDAAQDAQGDKSGINCWDLDADGENDADEDVNADGEFNALDCQGADGQDGQSEQGAPGAPGEDGEDGKDGVDGQDGEDGEDGEDGLDGEDGADLTGVIARGWVPGVDYDLFPRTVGATYVPGANKAVGIVSVTRPAPEAGDPNQPTPGEYIVRVQLPEREAAYTRDELTVVLSVEARRLAGDPGPLYQLFGYWQIMPASLDGYTIIGDTVDIKILIKAGASMVPADGNFSIVVMAP